MLGRALRSGAGPEVFRGPALFRGLPSVRLCGRRWCLVSNSELMQPLRHPSKGRRGHYAASSSVDETDRVKAQITHTASEIIKIAQNG